MQSVAEYRAKADECRRQAQRSTNPIEREQYESMAKSWDDLANSMEVLKRRPPSVRKG